MGTPTTPARPPFPQFTRDSAMQKVRLAEDAWNSRDPAKVALAYTIDSRWRNRSEFINGRYEIIAFLSRKWANELDYRLIKEMWAFTGNRIAVRFAYEWHDDSDRWYRSYGMKTGNSVMMGSCLHGLHQSTTFLLWDQSANITGCSGVVPMTTQG